MNCKVLGCAKQAKSRGWCNTHYEGWRRNGCIPVSVRLPRSTCAVQGCNSTPRSRFAELCHAHYGRMRRHGTLTKTERAGRWLTNGYWTVTRIGHPLADKRGHLYEHRLVLWDKASGIDQDCYWCGKSLKWFARGACALVTDHVDFNKLNNEASNVVPSCLACNGGRGNGIREGRPQDLQLRRPGTHANRLRVSTIRIPAAFEGVYGETA